MKKEFGSITKRKDIKNFTISIVVLVILIGFGFMTESLPLRNDSQGWV